AWADPTMIRSVLLNLVGNGMKFTPEGGTVTVRAEEAGGRLAVSVEDTGVGMSASDVAKLFHLEKARSRNGTAGERGSGLGLILCKEMVERHGGTMAVESTKGEGSRFRFTLPLTPEDGPPEVETEGIEEAA
ncbi:MAG: ATP-binding protein, partial [Rhodothermaceae bacterium]|nr:ATP-binding protein [Rhodothermaceae bacterium]